MGLASLRFLQDETERTSFDFAHWQDHLKIVQAIKSQMGITIAMPPLHPVAEDHDLWARAHQSLHDAMNAALKIAGQDLKVGVFKPDWIDQNWQEHTAAAQILKLT